MSAFLSALGTVAEAQGKASESNDDIQRQLTDPLRQAQLQEANLRLQQLKQEMTRSNLPESQIITFPDKSLRLAKRDPNTGTYTFDTIPEATKDDPSEVIGHLRDGIKALDPKIQPIAGPIVEAQIAAGKYEDAATSLRDFGKEKEGSVVWEETTEPKTGRPVKVALDKNGQRVPGLAPLPVFVKPKEGPDESGNSPKDRKDDYNKLLDSYTNGSKEAIKAESDLNNQELRLNAQKQTFDKTKGITNLWTGVGTPPTPITKEEKASVNSKKNNALAAHAFIIRNKRNYMSGAIDYETMQATASAIANGQVPAPKTYGQPADSGTVKSYMDAFAGDTQQAKVAMAAAGYR